MSKARHSRGIEKSVTQFLNSQPKTYLYNQNQRLIRVTDTGNVLGEYIYNGNGQRADKLIPSQNKCTVFHYDQNGLLITESTRTGNIKAEYVYLNGQPLAKIEGNNVYYYHDDHLGTPMVMTDGSGNTVWQGEFLPFGEPFNVTGSVTNNLRFPGQYFDSETGLHQNWHRDYYDKFGRYIGADSLNLGTAKILFPEIADKLTEYYKSNPASQNVYVYVQNVPTRYSDPPGLLGWDTIIKQIVKQIGKKLGGKIVDSGDIESDSEGDADKDGVPNFLDPEYPPNQPCIQCHSGPRLPLGPACKPQK